MILDTNSFLENNAKGNEVEIQSIKNTVGNPIEQIFYLKRLNYYEIFWWSVTSLHIISKRLFCLYQACRQFHQRFKRAFFLQNFGGKSNITREKLPKRRLYRKCVCRMLMKFTPAVNFTNILSACFSYKNYKAETFAL